VPTTVARDHPGLCAAAERVVGELTDFESRLDRHDGVDHEQHRVFVGRGVRLACHLQGALLLADAGLYASALAVRRTAFEHHVQDLLLMTGTLYAVIGDPVEDDVWDRVCAEYDAQETRWARSLAERPTRSMKGRVTYVFRGIAERGDDPATTTDLLHPLYFEMDKYSPTVGRPADQVEFDDGLTPLEHRERMARENRDRWQGWLRWDALRRSLDLNGMYQGRDLTAIDVHYAFLSGFTHATNAGYDGVFDRYGSILSRGVDHFADELIQLYVAAIGSRELALLSGMEEREPPVRVHGRDEVQSLISDCQIATAPLWYPGTGPYEYDRVVARNRRHFSAVRAGDEPPSPAAPLNDDELKYYSDPLERLREMHRSFREVTTGIGWMSPWPNPTGAFW
jgi:hypothetical protein